ncbi:hypothetical protein [Streptomyces sp. NBC_00576]|uniref:hypothetical protein n=1 Tax=Streptomyces sp. NBC_00576 TaxID=2903665 RepID=UPI002E81003D|nr:hypothetical protein [Streptomyces sp. NBC_00576]WUB69734.1 hypothetical protein OG734_06440 [Streptomyces sp. NBC_00576]
MPQHIDLINGQRIRPQEILYASDADLAVRGITARDVIAMDWFRIPEIDGAPTCDVKGCDYVPAELAGLAELDMEGTLSGHATHRVTKRLGFFKRPK